MSNPPPAISRREMLARSGTGLGQLGLATLLSQPGFADYGNPMRAREPHFRPKAKAVIHLFMNGGPSHVDTFDPKPALETYAGKLLPGKNPSTERPTGAALPSPFAFQRYGQSGLPISELFAPLGDSADELCVIRSMHADVPNHEPSLMLMNCGESTLVRPSYGSWLSYGLGTANQNLPAFVALCPGGYPTKGAQNWQSSFLPGVYQGTHVDTKHKEVEKLIANIRNTGIPPERQKRQLDLLRQMNQAHKATRPGDAALEARIQSFELAYRMQSEATDAFDVEREPAYIREMYGNSAQARQILMARRLVERGVRCVQVWHGAGQPWDSHDDLEKNHRKLAGECAQAIGALIRDLKQRGMLDDVLVLWGGEFGRTPAVELPKAGSNAGKINGRDHNHHGFTVWMAGGGTRGGHVYGATDEFGYAAVDRPVHVHDLHATMLHLLGFDHEDLTYRFAGRDFRLTDVHGEVIQDLIS
jgi:hypothetical protein